MDNQLVFIMPWLLRKRSNTRGTRRSVAKEQDAKTLASIEMIQTLFSWFDGLTIPRKRLVFEADAWYGNQTMLQFIRGSGAFYQIDGKKN